MADNQVLIQIRGDVADINAKLADLKGHIGKVREEADKMAGNTKLSFAVLATGINQAIGVFQQVMAQVRQFTDAYAVAETATMKLAVTMRNQGDYTKEALKDLEDYAAQIQKTTAYEDDYVKARMATLKTYGMTSEEIKGAMKSVLDLASARKQEGMTAEQAADLIGKAYIGQTDRLKRYGIVIDESIPKGERFNEVLKQVQGRFGGAAAAELDTYAGQVAQLKNQLGDLAEVVGKTLLQAFRGLQVGLDMFVAGFWTMVEKILSGMSWLIGKLKEFSAYIGLDTTAKGLAETESIFRSGAENAAAAASISVASAAKHYDQMRKIGDIDAAIQKLKPGQRFIPPPEVDKAAESAREAWAKAARDIQAEIDKQGLDPLEKALIDLDKKVADLLEKAAKLPTAAERAKAGGLIETYRGVQTDEEITRDAQKDFDELLKMDKAWDDLAKKKQAAKEAEINAQLTSLDIAEKEGAYHRDTLHERIRLLGLLLSMQEQRLGEIDPKDTTAWNSQIDVINQTKLRLAEVRAETRPVFAELKIYAEQATDVWKQVGSAVTNAFKGMEDALVEFVKTGKLNFADFARSVIADLIRIQVRAGITGSLAQSAGSMVRDIVGLMSWGGFHSGGMGSEPTFYRIVPNPDLLPRYHKGLGPGERMSVTTDDEMILTPGQQKRMAELMRGASGGGPQSVRVEIVNQGQPVKATKAEGSFNGQEYIVSVVLDAINRDAYGMRRGMKGV
ncbi:MAG TPA: phage tail tape measure C-terminal domain-containing protein [Sedimentisphaerales bacterium]|nr:phage tail tape measure C-terminal domain-containing protein [Sedimentisphaerales bacterium]